MCDFKFFIDLEDEQEIYLRRMNTTFVNENYFFKYLIPGYVKYK